MIKHILTAVVDYLIVQHFAGHCTADCQLVIAVGVLLYEYTMSPVSNCTHYVILISIMHLHA